MRTPTLDAIAGQTARELRAHPAAPRPILDPTDPRFGGRLHDARGPVGDPARIFDPTDPEYGELVDEPSHLRLP